MIPERLVRKGSLDDVLAVVERPLDADAVNVFVRNGGHLPLLDLANAALREHNEAVNVRLAPEPVDGGRTCACACLVLVFNAQDKFRWKHMLHRARHVCLTYLAHSRVVRPMRVLNAMRTRAVLTLVCTP